MDSQTARTREFVARHLLSQHRDPDDETTEGCMVCVAFEWGRETCELESDNVSQTLQQFAERRDAG